MPLSLSTIKPAPGSRKGKKRIGRGLGSTGRYSGRGRKGQNARSGVSGLKLKGFRRVMLSTPKVRGFKSNRVKAAVVNVADLHKMYADGETVNLQSLKEKGLVSKQAKAVKILGNGTIGKKISAEGCLFSKIAAQKIIEAGGTIV